jgi:hypothetical protein
MRRVITGLAAVFLCLGGLAGVSRAQNSDQEQEKATGKSAIGFRIRMLPVRSLSVMGNHETMATTTANKTVYDWNFNTTSRSPMAGIGPAFEFELGKRTTVTAEVLYDRLSYQKVTNTYSGSDDPTTGNDERSRLTITENTKARLFDVPLLVHHSPFRRPGVWSHLYFSAGVTDRILTTIRTSNSITYADGTAGANWDRAQASKSNLLGAVVGVGFRFIDDFNIKVTPEIRYTRWAGGTFGTDSTQSPRNQIEIGLAFTR